MTDLVVAKIIVIINAYTGEKNLVIYKELKA